MIRSVEISNWNANPEPTTSVDSNPYKSPVEAESSHDDTQDSNSGQESRRHLYPLSSFLALFFSAAVTVILWIPWILLRNAMPPGDLLTDFIGLLIYGAIAVALCAIIRFFRTGALSTMLIAYVMWFHLNFVALVNFAWLTRSLYTASGHFDLALIPIIAIPLAILHGIVVGVRRRRWF